MKNANWGLCDPEKALAINAAAKSVITSQPLVEELDADEASVLMFSGQPTKALAVLSRIDGGDQRTRVVRAIVAAPALAAHGQTTEAVKVAETGFTEHLALGDELAIAHPATHVVNQVFALTEAGLAEAEQLARAGAEVVASHRVPIAQIWFAANLGRIALLQGKPVTARRYCAEAAGLAQANRFAGPQRLALSGLALAQAMLGDAEAATATLAEQAALPEFGFLGARATARPRLDRERVPAAGQGGRNVPAGGRAGRCGRASRGGVVAAARPDADLPAGRLGAAR